MELNSIENVNKYNAWFIFSIIFIIFDYGRPQTILPFLGVIRPQMLLIIVLMGFLLLTGQISNIKSRQTTLILLFILWLAILVPFARNNFLAFNTTLSMTLYLPFILSLIVLIDSFERLKQIIFIFVILMIWVSFYGITHSGVGPGNYFMDENDLSLYINIWLPFCYFLYSVEENRWKKFLLISGLLIGVLTVVATFSRGGFLGLVSILFIIWLYSKRKLLSLGIFVIIAIIVYLFADPAYWQDMSTISDTKESTAQQRLLSWEAGWDMFLDNPLGIGGNNFQVRFDEYQPEELHRNMWGRVAHSLWFTLIPELGLPGIILYLMLIIANFKSLFFLKKLVYYNPQDEVLVYFHFLALALISSLIGFFVSGSFVSVLYYAHFWYLTGIIIAATRVAELFVNGQSQAEHES